MSNYPNLVSTNQATTSITLPQLSIDVNQAAHTFNVGDAIYYDVGNTQWELADHALDTKLATHLVTSSASPLFSATTHGTVAWPSHGLGAVGTKLYLDTGANVGQLTATPPATRKQWVATVKDANSVIMVNLIEGANGPAASTDTAVARWSGTSGGVLQNSAVTIDGAGKLVPVSLQITTGAVAGKVLTSDASGNATWQLLASSSHINVNSFAFNVAPDFTAPNNYGSATWTGTATYWFELPAGTTQLASFDVKYFSLAALGTTLPVTLLDRQAASVTTTAANVAISTTTTTDSEHNSTNKGTSFTPSGVGQVGLQIGATPANMHIMSVVLNFA